MLAEGDALWARLDALLLERASRPRLHTEGETDWNSRDVYAHFARWIGLTIEQVQRKSAGLDWLPALPGTDDEINERWAAEDRALSQDEARAWCLEATATLRRLIGELSADQWTRFGHRCMSDIGGEHYRGHIDYIRGSLSPG